MNEFERAQHRVDRVDFSFEAFDLGGQNAQRAGTAPAVLGRAQIGAEVEQIVLDTAEHRLGIGVGPGLDMQAGDADRGVGLVDRAVGGDAQRVLGHPGAIAERGLAAVAAAGINPGQPHHDLSPVRTGRACPGASAGPAASAGRAAAAPAPA